LLFCIAVGLEAGGLVMALPRWAQQPASPSPSAHPRNRGRNVLAGFSLAILFVVPMVPFMVPLYDQSTVVIRLDSPMYTVTGEAVTTVALRPRTAMILLNDPHTTATPGPELIRPAKTVRLAAYLYVIANSTVDECVTWVGNNLDVYSLNLCGWVLSPGNVSAMKSLNPAGRFYFMVWGATTLFEDANSTYPPGEWNPWSQTAWVKFNDTMLGWTLKLKDGSEAIGINRKNSTDAAHVMDLGKMEWADYFAWIYTNRAKQYHADGLAIDEVMWRGYWGVDLATLRDYTSLDEIEATCYQWLARVDQKTDLEVITQAYWPEAQESQDGVWGETAFGYVGRSLPDDRYNVVWYEANNWEGVVHDLEAKGQQNDTYIWAAWYHQDDPAEREYAVATYLMGKQNGILSVGFHPQPIYGAGYDPDVAGHPGTNFAGYSVRTAIDEVQSHPELFDLELGDAAGPMYLLSAPGGQYWRRDFENGIVVVNSFHQSIPWSRGDTGFDSDRDGIDDAIELEHGSSRFDDNDFPVMLVVGPPLAASAAVLGVLLGSMLYKRRKPVGGLPGTAARNENLP
nr:hypothetical protein [Candidatus Sigynarchaeota archaeon]